MGGLSITQKGKSVVRSHGDNGPRTLRTKRHAGLSGPGWCHPLVSTGPNRPAAVLNRGPRGTRTHNLRIKSPQLCH